VQTVDVLIAGGAVTGSSVAYHLAADPDFTGTVLVVEPDPTYARAATTLSAGSIRQQFSNELNVAMSLHGIDFLRSIAERLEVDGEVPDLGLHEGGYLFLAGPHGREVLAANHGVQTRLGADIVWLEADALV
jgi:glycine/D-amino acid oxidase-like deaminating enzyme